MCPHAILTGGASLIFNCNFCACACVASFILFSCKCVRVHSLVDTLPNCSMVSGQISCSGTSWQKSMPRPVPNPGSHIFDFIKSLHPPMHFPHSVYLISFYALLVYTLHIFIGLGILTWPVKLAGKSLARIYVYTKIFVGLPFTPYIFSQLLNTCLYL